MSEEGVKSGDPFLAGQIVLDGVAPVAIDYMDRVGANYMSYHAKIETALIAWVIGCFGLYMLQFVDLLAPIARAFRF